MSGGVDGRLTEAQINGLKTWLAHVDPDDPVRMPQLVVDAIQALVEEVREQRRVTAPSAARLKSR